MNSELYRSWHLAISRNTFGLRLVRGIGANLLSQVLIFGQNILLVPLFLGSWGIANYGDWLALSAAAGYLSLLDGGIQMYVVNLMNISRARKDDLQFHQVLHSALLLYLVIIGGTFLLVASLVWSVPWVSVLGLKMFDSTVSIVILMLMGLQVLISIPSGLILGIYRSISEYDRGQNVSNGLNLITLVTTIVALIAGGGPMLIAGILVLRPLLTGIVSWWDVVRRHPDVRIGLSQASWKLGVTFFVPSLFFFLFPLANSLSIQGSSLILAATLGSTSLVLFTTTRTLGHLVRQLFGAVNTALWPEMTSLFAIGDLSRLRVIQMAVCKYSFGISLVASCYLLFFATPIFAFWTRNRLEPDQVLLGIFLINAISTSIWYTSSTLQVAANYHKNPAVRSLLSAVASVILAFILVRFWRERGVALAVLASELLFNSYGLMRNTCRILEVSTARFLLGLLVSVAPFGSCIVAFAWLSGLMVKGSLNELILATTTYGLLTAVSVWFVLLDSKERKRLRQWAFALRSSLRASA